MLKGNEVEKNDGESALWPDVRLSHFVTADSYLANKVDNPPRMNTVWFDDVVLAKEYIGPMTMK